MIATPASGWSLGAPRAVLLAGLLLAGALLAGCGGPGVRVTVVNAGGVPLADLRVATTRDSVRVAGLASGDSAVAMAPASDEEALVLRGRAGDRPLAAMMPVYAEPGGHVRLVVDSSGFVRVPGR